MTDRLTSAFNMLRQGGAIFAGRARLTGWSDSPRGMGASFRLDASADALDNPATHPFKGMHVSPKDGDEFMVLVIPVANMPAEPEPEPAPEPAPPPADKRRWTDLPMSQRAALLCADKLFSSFLCDRFPDHWDAGGCQAVPTLRRICRIESRSHLNTNADAAQVFDRLARDFFAWKNEPVDHPF